MTSIEEILGTVAVLLSKVLGVGIGSLAGITGVISGISEGGSPPLN